MSYLLFPAVAPAVLLFVWIYRKDRADREPASLLIKIFVFGAISVFPVMLAELILSDLLLPFFDEGTIGYLIADNFVSVALVEEYGKMKAAKLAAWKHPAFNYRFDAILYCAVSSLGFATLENIFYVFDEGAGTAVLRAFLSVPSHMIDGLMIGYFFGLAREAETLGHHWKRRWLLLLSVLVPSVEHGIYDSCLSSDSDIAILVVFPILVIASYFWAVWFVRRQSRNDRPLPVHS